MDYRCKAIECIKNTALPYLRAQFEECGCSLDEQYKKYGNSEFFFAEIIEPNHVYEIGYHQCYCPDVLEGRTKDTAHCECSRQAMIYVFEELLPDRKVEVETIKTVLEGAENCRFRITVK